MARIDLNAPILREVLEQRRAEQRIRDDAEVRAGSLTLFMEAAWQVVEPATVFSPNWHIAAICEHLEAVARGEIRRLLINMPPRHGKSLIVSVFFPVWYWTWAPYTRFITVSYGAELAERHAVLSRDLLRSLWYETRWPGVELKGDVNRQNRYENTQTGYRIATSVGGPITGEGGDVIIVDDPHKIDEAGSENARNRVIDWHDGTLTSRFNDPKAGSEIVVMQRLHEQDLSGHLLEHGGWTHLCIPSRFERHHPFLWPGDPRTDEGELLWPDHVPEPAQAQIERSMGSFRAAGQLQQRPAAPEGELLKRAWWQFFSPAYLHPDKVAMLPKFSQIISSWDTAFENKTTSDYVVGQVWGIASADRYLLYSYRRHANLHATKEAMRAAHRWVEERWPAAAHSIVIEKAANAAEIVADLKRELTGVIAEPASQDKMSRAIAAAPPLEAGNIFLPGQAAPDTPAGYQAPDWVASFIEEAATFPNGRYDDQVDAYSQAINWARTHNRQIHATIHVPTGYLPINYKALGLDGPGSNHSADRAAIDHAMSFKNQHPTMERLFGVPPKGPLYEDPYWDRF
jgi:predicted phage terminase large subunit-like protein